MSALQKADSLVREDCDVVVRDATAYHDDVTQEGVQLLREKASHFLGNRRWKVIDGYVGSDAARVDQDTTK